MNTYAKVGGEGRGVEDLKNNILQPPKQRNWSTMHDQL